MNRYPRPIDRVKHFSTPDRVVSASPLASDGVSPLRNLRAAIVDDLPQALTLSGGFDALPTSATNNPTQCGWVDLLKVTPDDYGQELLLMGATIEQLAADVAGTATGNADARAWGDRFGRGVAIVIAQDLTEGRRDNGWYERPAPDSSMGYNAAASWATGSTVPAAVQLGYSDRYLFSLGWCVGSMADALPYQRVFTKSFAPSGFRLARGHSLHVAFVTRPNTLDPGATLTAGTFYGHCRVQLHFAKTEGDYGYERR